MPPHNMSADAVIFLLAFKKAAKIKNTVAPKNMPLISRLITPGSPKAYARNS